MVHGSRTAQWGPARSEFGDPVRPGYFHPAYPWEWRINPSTQAVSDRQISTISSEFARHDPRRVGQKTRYGYFAAALGGEFGETALFDSALKLDVQDGTARISKPDGLTAPGETIFVPRPGGDGEDDGWTLTIWWNPSSEMSELVIEDAQRFGEGAPVARVVLPFRKPLGFHGNWHS